jgi:biopolymer transport protein ExbD
MVVFLIACPSQAGAFIVELALPTPSANTNSTTIEPRLRRVNSGGRVRNQRTGYSTQKLNSKMQKYISK